MNLLKQRIRIGVVKNELTAWSPSVILSVADIRSWSNTNKYRVICLRNLIEIQMWGGFRGICNAEESNPILCKDAVSYQCSSRYLKHETEISGLKPSVVIGGVGVHLWDFIFIVTANRHLCCKNQEKKQSLLSWKGLKIKIKIHVYGLFRETCRGLCFAA